MSKVGLLAFATDNLGDDLQAMAASAFLPRVDRMIDRDLLSKANLPEAHLVVMNSWFQLADRVLKVGLRKKRFSPSDSIDPLFYGFCLGTDRLLNDSWIPYLAAHQPIGSRDRVSIEKLASQSIAAQWTGCITLFFGRKLAPVPASERSGIVFVDLPARAERAFVPKQLRDRARRLTNVAPREIVADPLRRMHRMAQTCDILRRAELVVTSRLHVTLPCVGFGTPVVAVVGESPRTLRRFSGFDEFVPIVFWGGKRSMTRIDWDNRTPAVIPQEIEEPHRQLLRTIETRLGKVDGEIAPDVAAKFRITVSGHDLGGEAGEVLIDFGHLSVVRPAAKWTKDTIEAEIEGMWTLRRFDVPLRARPRGEDRWVDLGPLGPHLTSA
ncbi:MAG: polysaccharide pyruvyl transferase family protein [Bauldia sp.]